MIWSKLATWSARSITRINPDSFCGDRSRVRPVLRNRSTLLLGTVKLRQETSYAFEPLASLPTASCAVYADANESTAVVAGCPAIIETVGATEGPSIPALRTVPEASIFLRAPTSELAVNTQS